MIRKAANRSLSVLIVLTIIFSAFVMSSITVSASEKPIPIRIIGVSRRYNEAKTFIDKCNQYRKSVGLKEWIVDEEMVEQSMKRAAELSIYASLVSPDGTYYSDSPTKAQLIGYDILSDNALLNSFETEKDLSGILRSSLPVAGVGAVIVNQKKYICILLTSKTPTPVSDAVMSQTSVNVDQELNVLPSILSDVSPMYSNGQQILCGSSIDLYMRIKNQMYGNASVYITADNMNMASSNTKYITIENGRVKAVQPGKSVVAMSLGDAPQIKTTCLFEAVGYKLDDCVIADIEDQYYTGEEIRPGVSITTKGGAPLILGTDYRVSYSNNVEIGTATITITGLNAYTGSTFKKNFNIIKSPYGNFKVTQKALYSAVSTGEKTTLTATVTGGTAPINYTFEYAPYDTALWKTLQSSSSPKCEVSFNAVGNYNVRVKAVDAEGRTSTAVTVIIVNQQLTIESTGPSSITLGESYSVTSKVNGGVAPLVYSCYVKKSTDSSWTTVNGYSFIGNFTYTPKSKGSYTMYVQVKSGTGYTVKDYVYFTVKDAEFTNSSTISSSSITLGNSVTINGIASGGTGKYTYSLLVTKPSGTSWITVKSASEDSRFVYKPTMKGTYKLAVKIKDSEGRMATKTFSLTVKEAEKPVLKASISASSITLGNSVTLNASASGGSGSYQYAYYYKLTTESSWKTLKDYSALNSKMFKPSAVGNYDVCIKVKDSAGTVVKDYFVLNVKGLPALLNNSTMSASSITLGDSVKLYGAASGGAGSYQYAYFYKLNTTSSWKTVKNYSATTMKTITPSAAGNYDVCIKVKDMSGTITKKYFTLKVASKPALVNKSTISASSISLGNNVKLNGSATGGTSPYQYAYFYKLNTASSWKTVKDYSATTMKTVTPSAAGTYDICIKVKDGSGTVSKKYFVLKVTK